MTAPKKLRLILGVTQQTFASLLGLRSFVSVNRWENGHAKPGKDATVLLELLESAMTKKPAYVVLDRLQRAGGNLLEVVRTLCELERQ